MGMQLIETIEVGAGGAASIEFTSIPDDGVDLCVVYSLRDVGGSSGYNAVMRFNGDTGANYTTRWLLGSGSAVSSSTIAGSSQIYAGKYDGGADTANTFGNGQVYISNYTSAVAKSISAESVSENNATAAWQTLSACVWTGTAAISSWIINASSGFAQYSTASIYKITAD